MLTMPRDRTWIAARIPHQGHMCLLDELLDADENSARAATRSHLRADNPLRESRRLGGACALEYAGQLVALHASLRSPADATPRGGVIAAVREFDLSRSRLDDLEGPLVIECRCLAADARTLSYAFTVRFADDVIASGRLTVVALTADSDA